MNLKKLVFVSGKGGTGKTTLALILARKLALTNKKVLFVEMGKSSSAKALLDYKEAPEYSPRPISLGFDWCRIEGHDCLTEYVGSIIKVEKLAQSFFENSFVQSLISVAPGLNDLAILGKLTSHLRQHGPGFNYDHIIVDAPSTGSFNSFLQAPLLLGESVKSGPMHSQSKSINETLYNPDLVQYFFVSLHEELPVDELLETYRELYPKFKNQIAILMNKNLNLNQVNGVDKAWQSFISKANLEQREQRNRLEGIECEIFTLPLFTMKFNDFLLNWSRYESF